MWKECTKCGRVKPLWKFYKAKKGKFSVSYICKKCHLIICRKYQKNNPDIVRKTYRKYQKNNPDIVGKINRKWQKNNHEKILEYNRNRRKTLSDGYIRKLLTQKNTLTATDIPPELIALKREEIKLKRLIKEKSNV